MQSVDKSLGPNPMDYPTQRERAEVYSEWFQLKENVMHDEPITCRASALNALIRPRSHRVEKVQLTPDGAGARARRETADLADEGASEMFRAANRRRGA